MKTFRALLVAAAVSLAFGCSGTGGGDAGAGDAETDTGAAADAENAADAGIDAGQADTGADAGPITWNPGNPPSAQIPVVREWSVARSIIHAHNIYSHDACDNKPWLDPADSTKDCHNDWWTIPTCVPNEQCVSDLRAGVCTDAIDAFFLTDHSSTMSHPDNFDDLYIQRTGDTWVEENGVHTGSRITCENGNKVVVMVGTENEIMPIGLTAHVPGDAAARGAIYGATDAAAVQAMKDAGAVVAVNHSEQKTVDYLRNTPVEAIEIYNFHVTMLSSTGVAELAPFVTGEPGLPTTDLAFLAFYNPLSVQLTKWYSTVFVRDVTAIIGTDIHRNAIPKIMADGERLDSYRRFIRWFSNHLLVKEYKPSAFKDAVRSGRMYVVAEGLGTPSGFDFYADTSEGVKEQGGTVDASKVQKLVAKRPFVLGAPDTAADVKLTLKKIGDGTADVVQEFSGDMEAAGLGPGVYYVEVHFTPRYLRPLIKNHQIWDQYIRDFVWIYSNAIRLR